MVKMTNSMWRNGSSIALGRVLPFSMVVFSMLVFSMVACDKLDNTTQKAIVAPEGMVFIPAGEFIMGSDDIDASGKSKEFGFNEPWYLPEHPKRKVFLDNYFITGNNRFRFGHDIQRCF